MKKHLRFRKLKGQTTDHEHLSYKNAAVMPDGIHREKWSVN